MDSQKQLFIQIYKILFLSTLKKSTSQHDYINILQNLCVNGFKTYHIDNFNKVLLVLQQNELLYAHKISSIIHKRDTNHKIIIEFLKYFRKINKLCVKGKLSIIEKVEFISKLCIEKEKIVKAFINIDGVIPRLNNSVNRNFAYYQKCDIIQRLHDLLKYFTLSQLIYMNIEIKLRSEIEDMNNGELVNYYKLIIRSILDKLSIVKEACRSYIDNEINYVECYKEIIDNNV